MYSLIFEKTALCEKVNFSASSKCLRIRALGQIFNGKMAKITMMTCHLLLYKVYYYYMSDTLDIGESLISGRGQRDDPCRQA